MKKKHGAQPGNKNASNTRNGLMGGIPAHLMTSQLVKALKQFERVDPDDPKRNVKRGQAIRKIADNVVERAIDGDMAAIQYCMDRVDGKARQVNENVGKVEHQHSGLKVTFEPPPMANVIEHEH